MALTAADIAWHMRLYAASLRHEWITPNALLYAWESDLLTVTPEGFVCEIEIKVSRNDLKNDLLKPKHAQGMLLNGSFQTKEPGTGFTVNEAQELARQKAGALYCRRPNYFCFAMPCDVYRQPRPMALHRTPASTPWTPRGACSRSAGRSSCTACGCRRRNCSHSRGRSTTAIGRSCGDRCT